MQFTVTAAELNNAANTCTTYNSSIQTEILQMRSYITGLMAVYQGRAALQLDQLSQSWGRAAVDLNDVLTEIATNLRANAVNYIDHEDTNAKNYGNLMASLPAARF